MRRMFMLIRNGKFTNAQLLVGGKKITFNNEGIADIPDQKLCEALLKIKGFTDASDPVKLKAEKKLQEVKSISIDELNSLTNPEPEEEPVQDEEESVRDEEEPDQKDTPTSNKSRPKSKKKGR
jgi:hypothetical protein